MNRSRLVSKNVSFFTLVSYIGATGFHIGFVHWFRKNLDFSHWFRKKFLENRPLSPVKLPPPRFCVYFFRKFLIFSHWFQKIFHFHIGFMLWFNFFSRFSHRFRRLVSKISAIFESGISHWFMHTHTHHRHTPLPPPSP